MTLVQGSRWRWQNRPCTSLGNLAIDSGALSMALDAIRQAEARAADGGQSASWRVLLFNDRFNTRKRVEQALVAAGLECWSGGFDASCCLVTLAMPRA